MLRSHRFRQRVTRHPQPNFRQAARAFASGCGPAAVSVRPTHLESATVAGNDPVQLGDAEHDGNGVGQKAQALQR